MVQIIGRWKCRSLDVKVSEPEEGGPVAVFLQIDSIARAGRAWRRVILCAIAGLFFAAVSLVPAHALSAMTTAAEMKAAIVGRRMAEIVAETDTA